MKKILLAFLIIISSVAHAQLNNSWIDYSKTYYKFKLLQTGLYRIPQSVLASAGLGGALAEQFQLWRNGQQVRLYTSTATGPLGNTDYIEFWGQMNDGKPDRTLYNDTTYQPSDAYSLSTDSASYFLTTTTASNFYYTNTPNNTAANTLAQEPYFMRKIDQNFKQNYNLGFGKYIPSEVIYASRYDIGEGFTNSGITDGTLSIPYNNLNAYTAGPTNNVSFNITACGTNNTNKEMQVKLFNTLIIDTNWIGTFYSSHGYDLYNITVNNIPLSALVSADNAAINISSIGNGGQNSTIVIGHLSFTYPSTFNFNNQQNFYFELPATTTGNFIVINNFNNNNVPPVLYDKNSGNRYIGDISTPGQISFALPPSSDVVRGFLLVSEDLGNVNTINSLTSRTFVNYGLPANQGNYLIISNAVLFNDGKGVDNVEKYRQYRASIAGGNFNAKTVRIDEITDQFAFGISRHPTAVRDFIRFSSQQFRVTPEYIFIIGGGVAANAVAQNVEDSRVDLLDLVPTFGYPASDILLACDPKGNVPLIPIGRLSAINGSEVGDYLSKMIEYEAAQSSTSQTMNDKAWMKNFIHLSGGNTVPDDNRFTMTLNSYAAIAKDTLYGGDVQTFRNTSPNAVNQVDGSSIDQLINNGVSVIDYFGHGSSTTLAYNLNTPQSYQNQGKYYFFNVSGCIVGDNYEFDLHRLAGPITLSEEYTSAAERGCIGFLGGSYLGVSTYLDRYNIQFYTEFCHDMYGNSVGNQMQRVCQVISQTTGNLNNDYEPFSFLTSCNMEELNLNGDPALKINSFALPDYDIEDQLIQINPTVLSVADTKFTLNVKWLNIGKAVGDSMRVLIERKLPNGTLQILYNQKILSTKYSDSLSLVVPINPLTDKGSNQIIVSLDADNNIAELSETNNLFVKTFQIFASELLPVYPYNYSIVNQQNITYSSSTANPIDGQNKYLMQVDTTLLFNSPFLKQYNSTGIGGVIQFTPTDIAFTDSTVYYWRTTIVPTSSATPEIWNWYSFVYLSAGGPGFNQSHYYQHLQSNYSNISLNGNRTFTYAQKQSKLTIRTGINPYTDYDNIDVYLDGTKLDFYGCLRNSLQFYVYDSATLQPIKNYNNAAGTHGRFNSHYVCSGPTRDFFDFDLNSQVERNNAVHFFDSIPSGCYVSITNLGFLYWPTSYISTWQADQATYGAGNDLYDKLKGLGFSKVDSFTKNIPILFFYQKDVSSFTPLQFVGLTPASRIAEDIFLLSRRDSGSIQSPIFGPAKNWNTLHWRGKDIDAGPGDFVQVQVYGIKTDGSKTLLATVSPAIDTSLAFISAATYPYLQLQMLNTDATYATPNQLQYWRINADYVPEGAIAPNILYTMTDTVSLGQNIPVALAFKNVSPVAFDSVKVAFVITDANNISHTIPIPKGKALISDDTMVIRDTIMSQLYPGANTLYIMFNPNNAQPEQYLFNNFLYKTFYVKNDLTHPLLDVTFDGTHILNKDIVSAKPTILIKLTDENKYLALTDTNSIKLQVVFPDGTYHTFTYGDNMRFIPANLTTGSNVASLEFTPIFNLDGLYQLVVSGKDVNSNTAGNISYKVSFTIINKSMISNLLNYPNPFTTSTAFVFTLTGTQIPQGMRIQILTITGKVVKEISQAELGPIHIGANITEYKWDGTDRYGQKLANGVYLYRVLTNLNGKSLDNYNGTVNGQTITEGLSNTDQYFTKGYGKMYLMR